jgi:hypothetical protein
LKKSSTKNIENNNTALFGIVSNEKFYRMAYFINKHADIELERQPKLLKINIYNQKFDMPYYHFQNTDYEVFFLENSFGGNKLIKKFKNIHFWFLIKTNPLAIEVPSFDKILNDINQALAVFPIKEENDKNMISSIFFT